MPNNRLNVIHADNEHQKKISFIKARPHKEEIQASMERLWLQSPEQFDPSRNCMDRKRINDTFKSIESCTTLIDKKAVDLGCGAGILTRKMRDAGAIVDAVDAASQALQKLKSEDMHNIIAIQDTLPSTSLHDQTYDLVVCTEVIGYLKSADFRMLMAELARLVKNHGFVICSTELDINTNDPLEKFATLAETEFTVEKWFLSYHLLQIRLCRIFEKPAHYLKCHKDAEQFRLELNKRKGLSQLMFLWNTQLPLSIFWKVIGIFFNPLASLFRQNVWIMNVLEKLTRFFWGETGISHALFIGKRRPLAFPVAPENQPREIKHKRQVWE